MSPEDPPEFTALVPAGGTGVRLGGALPKQFLPIAGRPMLAWTIDALLGCDWIARVDVVVSATQAQAQLERVREAVGGPADKLRFVAAAGATRRDSVLGGLEAMGEVSSRAWVLVHDAARPGVGRPLLERLRAAILAGAPGALAANPVADTVKRALASAAPPAVEKTIPRAGLWMAQTPQVFRVVQLREALRRHPDVTDESSAMERTGIRPELVPSDWQNLKVTRAQDLQLMQRILEAPVDA